MLFFLFVFSAIQIARSGVTPVSNTTECWSCQGGFTTPCATVLPEGTAEPCEGNGAQCYEAVKVFQNGAIVLLERRCYIPPENATETQKDYCKQFSNPVGYLAYCKTCTGDLCNGHLVKTNKDGNPYISKTNKRCKRTPASPVDI